MAFTRPRVCCGARAALEQRQDTIADRHFLGIADFSPPSPTPGLCVVDPDTGVTRAHLVAHGAWHVSEQMIGGSGMLGRSQGCLAVADSSLPEIMAHRQSSSVVTSAHIDPGIAKLCTLSNGARASAPVGSFTCRV